MTEHIVETHLKGIALLKDPLLNKQTAFTEKERSAFHLDGLLPPHVETIEQQEYRCYQAYCLKNNNLEKHIYLRALQDRNETLFYKLLLSHITEMLPIVYTPVVGEACIKFSNIYRQPRGLFVAYPHRGKIKEILKNIKSREVKVIVVTDGERILGLGDQGAGGMGIPIGKLSLYTACGGINPANTLPILLDVGTNNQDLHNDPSYIGWRHNRITGKDYDDFIEEFIVAVKETFPGVLLQFEDFAKSHAFPLLKRYQHRLCSFNDDIQGTAAVVVGTLLSAVKVTGNKIADQRIIVFGAGSAGCGISEQIMRVMMHEGLTENEARSRFFMIDQPGLLTDDLPNLLPFQIGLAQNRNALTHWQLKNSNQISFDDVVHNAKATILLGVSAQPHVFTQSIVKDLLKHSKQPIIFPLSNPISQCEALPADILNWTNGAAIVATGSPFDNVIINGEMHSISQCNNSYIFPGVGLGVLASQSTRVTDEMMMAAAIALSDQSPAQKNNHKPLLPLLENIREVSKHIAFAVGKMAIQQGYAPVLNDEQLSKKVEETMWEPIYYTLKHH